MKGLEGQIQSEENNNESQRSLNSKGYELVHRYDDLFAEMYKKDLTLNIETQFIVSNKFIEKWKEYCLSDTFSPSSKSPIIDDEIFHQGKLKPGLKYKTHYQILDQNTFILLQPFFNHQNQNQRSVKWQRQRQNNQIAPSFIIQCNYLILNPLILRKIDCGYLEANHLQYKTLLLKDQTFLHKMIDQIFLNENTDTDSVNLQLWHLTNQTQIPKIYYLLRTKLNGLCFEEYEIQNIGKHLRNIKLSLSDVAISPQKMFFLLQEVKTNAKPIFIENFEGHCRGCRIKKTLLVQCPCGKIRYCTQDCRKVDLPSHQPNCAYAEEKEFNKPIIMTQIQQSVRGRIGLNNLGNTCYMNSCLQCLSNTISLTKYFLKGFFEKEINKTNKLGTKGRLAKTYAKFIRETWCGISEVFAPTHLKAMIGKINPNFSGTQQQDAQQFFSFLIDGLHEDLNRVENKQNIPIEEDFSIPEAQLAKLTWRSFLGRNQSIITDLMTGQYLSSLRCPDCNQKSLKFETFNTVTLPIPIQTAVRFFVIHQYQNKKNIKGYFKYRNFDPAQWMKNACEAVDIKNPQRFLLYVVTQKENIYQVGRESMQEIVSKIENDNKNLFLIEKTDEEMMIPKSQLLELTISMTQQGTERKQIYFKFPMFLNKKTASQYEISKRILKYIFNQAYNDRKGIPITSQESHQYIKYEESMVRKHLFKVYLKYNKKIQRITRRTQAKFGQQILLEKKNLVIDFLTKYNVTPSDCEIEIRFLPLENTTEFSFHRMKKYEEHGQAIQIPANPTIFLESCFEAFSDPQVLMGGNEWYCPNCKQRKRAIKQIKIYRAPRILVIQLKRFKQKAGKKQKINNLVQFPFEIDLSKHIRDDKPMQAYRQEIKDGYIKFQDKFEQEIGVDLDSKPVYELYGVINHMGQLGGGHYTAYARNGYDWIKYDDRQLYKMQTKPEDIVTQYAFLLFYRRIEN